MDQPYLFNRGVDHMSYTMLGAHARPAEAGGGFRFAVWAPRAQAVSVVGSFNGWDPAATPLGRHGRTGIWTGAAASARAGDRYKFAVRGADGAVTLKADPYARHQTLRPENDSILIGPTEYAWGDGAWMDNRQPADAPRPLNLYEIHLGSWKRHPGGRFYTYCELADDLAMYLPDIGYTGIELMPVLEHPLDQSWGYQVNGFFAPTSRFGTPDDFRYFIDRLHRAGLMVLLDWVPAHFPRDVFALARFDGTPTYEYADPELGEHADWGTYIFDFSKTEVQSFLMSSAWYWLDEFHLDGLRVDAVSSMLYLNFGRPEGRLRNAKGGEENLDAVAFLRNLNSLIRDKKPQCLMVAEESTPWPKVTHPVEEGGLGFTHKWNMGWMHDTLDYFSTPFEERTTVHDKLTFSMTYAFSERFVLPLSHDEVVHGKRSLLERMPGDIWRKFAGLRLLYLYQLTHPGIKLTFMGSEFGPFIEWRFDEELEWFMLNFDKHRRLRDCVRDLYRLYRDEPALWRDDRGWSGFTWVKVDDSRNSVFAYRRNDAGTPGRTGKSDKPSSCLVILNASYEPHRDYVLHGTGCTSWRLICNTDDTIYGGSGYPTGGTGGLLQAPRGDLILSIPPLCGLILRSEAASFGI